MDQIAGKYEIVRELGEGSYGSVYLVRHSLLGSEYALKLLSPQHHDSARLIARFKQEAEILQRFTHPGLIHLRDFGVTDTGQYYMTMDYCPGASLEEHLVARGIPDVPVALDIVDQVLSALEAAHSAGIIHRDIKPENLIVQDDETGRLRVKILDFGVAKLKERLLIDSGTTSEGVAIGTPYYMSPEQAAGERLLDFRSDLYSVGVMLHRLLTGELPFQGESVIQTLLMHITKPVEHFAARCCLPPFFEEMVFRALAKDRVHRYQDASEFRHDISQARRLFFESRLMTADASAVVPVSVAEPPSSGDGATVEATRILCLDDNEMILQILRYILEGQGYEVFTATDFSVIHTYLFQEKAKLMLCDVNMPGIRGTKVCQMLKDSLHDLKIVLFSNIPERELEKLAAESRADDWLSKNARPEDWLEKVRTLLAEG
jgi:serine/threonine protein kinase